MTPKMTNGFIVYGKEEDYVSVKLAGIEQGRNIWFGKRLKIVIDASLVLAELRLQGVTEGAAEFTLDLQVFTASDEAVPLTVPTIIIEVPPQEESPVAEPSEPIIWPRIEDGALVQIEDWEAWWKARTSAKTKGQTLSMLDLYKLSEIAYLLSAADCYLSFDDLSKFQQLYPLGIYYNSAYIYDEVTGETKEYPRLFYPSGGYLDWYYGNPMGNMLWTKSADEFIFDLTGAHISSPYEDYQADWGYVNTLDGIVYCQPGDYEAPQHFVTKYRYLGENIFYVVFSSDDWPLSGPEEDHIGITQDDLRLLVKRSDSKWGFTAFAKLKYGDETVIQPEWRIPRELTKVRQRVYYREWHSPPNLPWETRSILLRMAETLADAFDQIVLEKKLLMDGKYTWKRGRYDEALFRSILTSYLESGKKRPFKRQPSADLLIGEVKETAGYASISESQAEKMLLSFFGSFSKGKLKDAMGGLAQVDGMYRVKVGEAFQIEADLMSATQTGKGIVTAHYYITRYEETLSSMGVLKVVFKPNKESIFGYCIDSFEFESLNERAYENELP